MAKQKVALECLSYHATASQDQTLKLAGDSIKSADEYKLYSFKFVGKQKVNVFIMLILITMSFIRFRVGRGGNVPSDDKNVC